MLGTVMKSLPQMWAAMLNWFTPTVLFVLLNVVIGTIAVTSGMRHNTNTNKDLRRNPSLFNRLSSFSFRGDKVEEIAESENQEETQEEEEKMVDNAVIKEEKRSVEIAEERESKVEASGTSEKTQKKKLNNGLGRSKSDTPPIGDIHRSPLPSKLKKSGTFESPFSHFDSQTLAALEATPLEVTPEVVNTVESDDNGREDVEEVDAKADDFINKFKQQLKLQRLESIMRYKEMINRGK